jgi:hypothetical protein
LSDAEDGGGRPVADSADSGGVDHGSTDAVGTEIGSAPARYDENSFEGMFVESMLGAWSVPPSVWALLQSDPGHGKTGTAIFVGDIQPKVTDTPDEKLAVQLFSYLGRSGSTGASGLPEYLMSPRLRVRVTFRSEPDGATITWHGQALGTTEETFDILAADIDKVDLALSGWLPCHAADARVPGWQVVDKALTVLVSCRLRKQGA